LLCCLQVLGLPAADRFPALLTVRSFDDSSLVMATSRGGIKRTALSAFSRVKVNGLAAIKLQEVGMRLVCGMCGAPHV
jgi:DNA gyrase subunit A